MGVHRIKLRSYHKEWIILSIVLLITLPNKCQINSTNISKLSKPNFSTQINISDYIFQNEKPFTNQEFASIIQLFDNIDNDFITIEEGFPSRESNTRLVRSVSIRPKCTISKDKLINMKNEINNILSFQSTDINENKCILNLNDTNNCNELTKVIQCGMQHLKNGFLDSIASRKNSIYEIIKWKNAYESLFEKYETESDNLKQAISQDYQLKFDKLQTDLQNLGESLNTALDRLQSTTIDLCVSKIMLGKTHEALIHSEELQPISISKVIKLCYHFKNDNDELKNFENIINFISKQSKFDNQKFAYETLYNEMDKKRDLNSLKIVLLAYGIRKSLAKDKLQGIYSKIEYNYSNKVNDLWANLILYNGKDIRLKQFAQNYYIYFTDHLSDIEKNALTGKIW